MYMLRRKKAEGVLLPIIACDGGGQVYRVHQASRSNLERSLLVPKTTLYFPTKLAHKQGHSRHKTRFDEISTMDPALTRPSQSTRTKKLYNRTHNKKNIDIYPLMAYSETGRASYPS